MPDRHKIKPKAVRMPGGLLAWIEDYAAKHGQPVNAVIVRALEEFREEVIKWEEASRIGEGDATVCEDCGQPVDEHIGVTPNPDQAARSRREDGTSSSGHSGA